MSQKRNREERHANEELKKELRSDHRGQAKRLKDSRKDLEDVNKNAYLEYMGVQDALGERTAKYGGASECMMDYKGVAEIAQIGSVQGRLLEREQVQTFSDKDFVKQLEERFGTSTEEDPEQIELDWVQLGGLASAYMRSAPSTSFLNGPFGTTFVIKQRKQGERRARRESGPVVKPQEIDTSKEEKTMTDERVLTLQSSLATMVNARRHMNLYEFAFNPDSYTESIENLYDMSYLVKTGVMSIVKEKDGLPYVQGKKQPAIADYANGVQSYQNIMPMNHAQWTELIKVLKIKKSYLPSRKNDDDIQDTAEESEESEEA